MNNIKNQISDEKKEELIQIHNRIEKLKNRAEKIGVIGIENISDLISPEDEINNLENCFSQIEEYFEKNPAGK